MRRSSEQRRFGRPAYALTVMIALLAFLVLSGAAMASEQPTIESEAATDITPTSATLEAVINPNGLETGYEFQIDTNGSYNYEQPVCPQWLPREITCDSIIAGPSPPVKEPRPEQIAAGFGGQTVSLNLASVGTTLQPGMTYHYRVIASNGSSTVQGPDQTFTTPPGGTGGTAPPEVQIEPAEQTSTGFRLKAKVNPDGSATSYYFIYKDTGVECEDLEGCGPSTPQGGPLTGDTQQEVQAEVTGLTPGQQYRYWLIARNANPEAVRSGELTFTVGSSPTIVSESVSHITERDATLEAQINTEGLETSYQFHLWAVCGGKGACQVVINYPLPSGILLGSFVNQSVSLDLNTAGVTLQPGGQYFYSVTATSTSGTAGTPEGSRSFITPEPVVQPLNTTTSSPSATGQPIGATNSDDQPSGSGGSSSSSTPGLRASGPQIQKTTKLEPLTNAQKLSKALKQCKKEPKSKRAACVKQTRKAYAAKNSKKR